MTLQWNPEGHLFDHQNKLFKKRKRSFCTSRWWLYSCYFGSNCRPNKVVYFRHHFLPHGNFNPIIPVIILILVKPLLFFLLFRNNRHRPTMEMAKCNRHLSTSSTSISNFVKNNCCFNKHQILPLIIRYQNYTQI